VCFFFSCVRSFNMEQRAMVKFYFKAGKTASEVYQDLKNVCSDDHVSRAQVFTCFKKAGNLWRMILVQAGQCLLSPRKMWRKLVPLWCRKGEWITTRLLAERLGVSKEAARKIMERDLGRRKIGLIFVPHYGWTERLAGWMLSQLQRVCWPRSRCVANSCDWWWKLVFSVRFWNEATKHGVTWKEFSSAKGSQVATIACQDNVDLFLVWCQNYP